MFFRHIFSVFVAASCALAAPAEEVHERSQELQGRSVAFNWGSQKIRGVGLGGWLVLEPFITPSLFRDQPQNLGIVDEYTFCQQLGKVKCKSLLKSHWDTFITLADFQKIKASGFNVVRIPIGYWAFNTLGRPFVMGQVPYLEKAIGWARQTGLKVIIDLHGAPRSQNGWDHSGQRQDAPHWGEGQSVANTLNILRRMSKYATPAYQDVVIAIEILNEPFLSKLDPNMVRAFYQNGYNIIRGVSDTPVMIHDGFWSPDYWNGFLAPSSSTGAIIDHHEYQIFDSVFMPWTVGQHVSQVCSSAAAFSNTDKWEIVGEWSAAMTDCAPELNGYGNGHRYDGTFGGSPRTGSCAGKSAILSWDQTMKDDTRRYIEAQIDAYEGKTQGWIFWNWKTEGAAEWDAQRLINGGVFPQPITARKFPKAC